MKKSKTVQKLSNKVDKAILQLDNLLKEEFPTYERIEHSVKYDLFPGSLFVQCFFNNGDEQDNAVVNEVIKNIKSEEKTYQKKHQKLLFKQGIVLKLPNQNLAFVFDK